MAPGRKPKPTKLKVLQGTVQPCRENKAEAKPKPHLPSPPAHLSKNALMEWGRITDELYTLGLLTKIDRAALGAYCQSFGRWAEAEEKISQTGMVIKTSNGNIIQNPLVGIANKAMELMHKFLTEFGMTPSSRARVQAQPQSEEKSPWSKISNG